MKLVSIIMSTYNTNEIFLRQAIESILSQSYKNIEFIIINDGSTNNDNEIIKSYKDDRIIYISHEVNKGLVYSLNEGIEKSTGEYIARMDSDDIASKRRIEVQVKYMEKNKNIGMTSTFFKMFGKEERYITNGLIRPKEIKCELLYRNSILHPGIMVRKNILQQYNLRYNEEALYTEDFELWIKLSKVCNIAIIPKTLMNYRIHETQIGNAKKQKQEEMTRKILNENLKNLGLDSKYIEYMEFLNNGKNREKIEFENLLYCIENIDKQNKICKIYNKKLQDILKNRVILQIIKHNLPRKYILKFCNKNTLSFFTKRLYYNFIVKLNKKEI